MKAKKKNGIKWTNFIGLFFAGIINACGVGLFLVPFGIVDGGLSGTSFILGKLTGLPISLWLVILNFPFFILAFKKMGWQTIIYSLFAISIYSIFLYVLQRFFIPADINPTVKGEYFISSLLLGAVFGGLISGIGSGLTIRFGGALDGIEVSAIVFHKKLAVTVGQFVMGYNLMLYLVYGIIYSSWDAALFSIISYYVGLKAVDLINSGLDKTFMALIISEKHEEIANEIMARLGRSMTYIKAEGYYKSEDTKMIYLVVNRFEVNQVREIITSIDDKAFVTFSEVSELLGRKLKKGHGYDK